MCSSAKIGSIVRVSSVLPLRSNTQSPVSFGATASFFLCTVFLATVLTPFFLVLTCKRLLLFKFFFLLLSGIVTKPLFFLTGRGLFASLQWIFLFRFLRCHFELRTTRHLQRLANVKKRIVTARHRAFN